jgi:preprotein translocase subunit SecD
MPRRRSSARLVVVVVVVLAGLAGWAAYVATRPSTSNVRRVILTPLPGGTVGDLDARLKDAAAVLQQRLTSVNRRATVAVQDGRLVVEGPPAVAAQVHDLGSPGQLEMRPVLEERAVVGSGTVRPNGQPYSARVFAALDCSVRSAAVTLDPARGVMVCAQNGTSKYHLGPARLDGTSVKGATVSSSEGPGGIDIEFTTTGQRAFTNLTRDLVGLPTPTNRLALVIDGLVLSAPTIQAVIFGDAQISGQFTQQQAKILAATIRYGALPFAFAISEG